jgi:membrane protein implicated in regulation of membrane protease activity
MIVCYNENTIQVIILEKLKGGLEMIAYPIFTSLAVTLFGIFEWNSLLLPLIWFTVIVLTLIVESQTADLVSIWFAPGAFVAMILAFCDVNLPIQLGVFVGLTIIGLILTFTVIRPRMKAKQKVEKTNVAALEGQLALVEEDVNNATAKGVAKINGQLWTARMEDANLAAKKGDWVEIVRVEGTKLICRPITE